jgi:hypothetical protein
MNIAYSGAHTLWRTRIGFGIREGVWIIRVAEIHAGKVLLDDEVEGSVKAEVDGGVYAHLIGCGPDECLIAREDGKDFAARVLNLRSGDGGVAGESIGEMGRTIRREEDRLLGANTVDQTRHLRPSDPKPKRVAPDAKLRKRPLWCCWMLVSF